MSGTRERRGRKGERDGGEICNVRYIHVHSSIQICIHAYIYMHIHCTFIQYILSHYHHII